MAPFKRTTTTSFFLRFSPKKRPGHKGSHSFLEPLTDCPLLLATDDLIVQKAKCLTERQQQLAADPITSETVPESHLPFALSLLFVVLACHPILFRAYLIPLQRLAAESGITHGESGFPAAAAHSDWTRLQTRNFAAAAVRCGLVPSVLPSSSSSRRHCLRCCSQLPLSV